MIPLAPFLWAAVCVASTMGERETAAKFQELDLAAQTALDRGQIAMAVERYQQMACLVPKSSRAFYGLGIAQAASRNFLGARKSLRTAFELLPSNVMALAMLVRVEVASKNSEALKEALRTAAERFPQHAELHAGLAQFLAANQELDLALAESLRAQRAGSAEASSAVALAVLENTVGAYHDAIRTAGPVENQAGVAEEVRASAAGVAGLSYESIGERAQAIEHLKLAIQLAPQQANSYLALAFLFEKAQKFDAAIEVLEQGRARLPQSLELLLPLGGNLVSAEQYPAGIELLKELLGKVPNVPDAYMRLAEAYRNTGETALEIETLERLARAKPDYPMVYVLIARAMLMLNPVDYPALLRTLALAERAAPRDADVHYLRGRAYAATGRAAEAIAAYQRASELRPMDPAPYYQLGLIYMKVGKSDLARQAMSRMEYVKAAAQGQP